MITKVKPDGWCAWTPDYGYCTTQEMTQLNTGSYPPETCGCIHLYEHPDGVNLKQGEGVQAVARCLVDPELLEVCLEIKDAIAFCNNMDAWDCEKTNRRIFTELVDKLNAIWPERKA